MNLHTLKSSRYLFAVGSVLLLPSAALCQDEKPKIDRTDPIAVVTAYLKACQDTDVDTAVSLLVADDPLRQMMPKMTKSNPAAFGRQGMDSSLIIREYSFLPMPMFRFPEPAEPVLTEEAGIVFVKRTVPLDQKFVLRQDEDGLWLIDLVGSITATTGAERRLLATQMQGAGGGGAAPGTNPYDCTNRLRTLSQGLEDYAADHGDTLPAADTWMDDLMPYILDSEVFKCPAAPDLECGYAFNIEVGGLAIPKWPERSEFVLLIEWSSGEPNATAFPAETENVEPRHGEQIFFATADRNTHVALKGETPSDVFNHKRVTEACQSRMGAICRGIRDYAKDNGGILPGADTWCDDIAPYLIGHPDGEEVYACPAVLESPYGYALNAEIAGKNATEMTLHRQIVVLMESDAGTRNASAKAAETKALDRHRATYSGGPPHGSHFGNLSGSVSYMPRGQDEKPVIDGTDPTAVVAAYLKACQDTDVDTAASLLVVDDPVRQMMPGLARSMPRNVEPGGIDLSLIMRESSFMPMPTYRFPEPDAPVLTEEAGVVLVKRTIPLDQKFVLRQDENGLWAIDLVGSITATSGAETSFMATQMQVAGGGGAPPGTNPYGCMNRLRILSQGLEDYAADHGDTLPAADTWMDDLMPYILDSEVFKCPAAPDLECGYAFNIEVGGLAIPKWPERSEFVLLIEWSSGEPNATAFPAETENVEPRHGEQNFFATADRNTHVVLKGETPEEVFNREQVTKVCSTRMSAISTAIRDYARDNAGFLPGPDTWCDDIMPYLMDQPYGEDVFACPAFPDALFGYAYNRDLEGKNTAELVRHRTIVVLMESDLGARNASASAADAVALDRHRHQYWVQGSPGSHFGDLSGSTSFRTAGQKPRTQ